MVNYVNHDLDSVFSALSDPTRRAMIERLAKGESSVTELARPFRISLPAISKHLRVLEEAGLVVRQKEGRVHHIRLNTRPLRETLQWIEYYRRFWEGRFDALDQHLTKAGKLKKR